MRHISDQDLQHYVDGDKSVNRLEIEDHLRICNFCQVNLSAYKQLFSGLKNEAGFMLSANFADAVVSRVEGKSDAKFDLFEIGFVIISALIGLGLLVYFTDLGANISNILAAANTGLSSTVKEIPFLSSGKIQLFAFAALIITLFGFLDKIILQMRHR